MKSRTLTFVVVLIGLVLGSFIGEVTKTVPYMGWLNYGKVIGIPDFNINLYTLQFNMGLTFNCTIACIVGLIVSLIIYYKFVR